MSVDRPSGFLERASPEAKGISGPTPGVHLVAAYLSCASTTRRKGTGQPRRRPSSPNSVIDVTNLVQYEVPELVCLLPKRPQTAAHVFVEALRMVPLVAVNDDRSGERTNR